MGRIAGPAVAMSPTGKQLAMGPVGPPGPQGPIGPAGPSGGGGTSAPVTINGSMPMPYLAAPNSSVRVLLTHGSVSVKADVSGGAWTVGQLLTVKLVPGNTPTPSLTVTILPAAGGQIEQLVPNNGTYGSSVILNAAEQVGSQLTYQSDGAGNLEQL